MPVGFIKEGGRDILYADFEGLKNQDKLLEHVLFVAETLKKSNGKTVLLVNFINASLGPKVMSSMKKEGKYVLKNTPLTTAVFGINGLKKVLVNGYVRFTNSKLRVFKTKKEAISYLVSSP